MASWRENKRNMRRGVHRKMCVPALYIHASGATPFPLTIRGPHTKRPVSIGDLEGGGSGWAEKEDIAPKLIFLREELPDSFRTGAIVSVEDGEAYRIAVLLPPDDVIVTAEVVVLDKEEAASLPLPDGAQSR